MALPIGLLSGVMLLEGTVLGKSECMNEDREHLTELYQKSYAALF